MFLSLTFQEFVDSIFYPIRFFVNWLSLVADSLLDNYIFIFFLCMTLALSLLYLVINFITNFFNSKIDDIDKEVDRYNDYVLYKKIQYKYLNNHRIDEYQYIYDLNILKQQVMNGIYRNHPDLLLDNKINNLKLNSFAMDKMYDESFDILLRNKVSNYRLNIQALKAVDSLNKLDRNSYNDNDLSYISNKNNYKKVSVPSWLDNPNLEGHEITKEEQKELEDLLNNF